MPDGPHGDPPLAGGGDGRPVRVLQSFPSLRDTTNPYLKQLYESLSARTEVQLFSWRRAIGGGYDVLHLHWPEVLLRGSTRPRTAARRLAFLLVLLRIRLSRRVIVRTMHNAAPHEAGRRVESALLRLTDRWTGLWIALVPQTPIPAGSRAPVVVIPHGHYIDWFAALSVAAPRAPVAGRLLTAGLIRRYKGVEDLLAAFAEVDDPGLSLRIVGRPADRDLGGLLERAAERDRRVSVRLEYVTDADLADEIAAAEVLVLPYRKMLNSGVALLALSLRRPVLMPRAGSTVDLAAEVGPGWVFDYDPADGITAAALERTHLAVRSRPADLPGPDLSHRGWDAAAEAHLQAYRTALDARRAGRA